MSDNEGISAKNMQPQISLEATVETVIDLDGAIEAAIGLAPKAEDKKTPAKRTYKRVSFIERAQKESEELVKYLGGSLEGGRRTRSSSLGRPARPSTALTPPRGKKSRSSLENSNESGGLRARGRRGGRIIKVSNSEDDEAKKEVTPENSIIEKNDEKPFGHIKKVSESEADEAKKEVTPEVSVIENSDEKPFGHIKKVSESEADEAKIEVTPEVSVIENNDEKPFERMIKVSKSEDDEAKNEVTPEDSIIEKNDEKTFERMIKVSKSEDDEAKNEVTPEDSIIEKNDEKTFGHKMEGTPEVSVIENNDEDKFEAAKEIVAVDEVGLGSSETTKSAISESALVTEAEIAVEVPLVRERDIAVGEVRNTEKMPSATDALSGALETEASSLEAAIVMNDSINNDVAGYTAAYATNFEGNKPEVDFRDFQ